MRRGKLIVAVAVAIGLVSFIGIETGSGDGTDAVSELIGAKRAQADVSDRRQARRVARRTARRVARRHARLSALPNDCVAVVVSGVSYWLCDSIYYQEIVEDGATVYIVVNP